VSGLITSRIHNLAHMFGVQILDEILRRSCLIAMNSVCDTAARRREGVHV